MKNINMIQITQASYFPQKSYSNTYSKRLIYPLYNYLIHIYRYEIELSDDNNIDQLKESIHHNIFSFLKNSFKDNIELEKNEDFCKLINTILLIPTYELTIKNINDILNNIDNNENNYKYSKLINQFQKYIKTFTKKKSEITKEIQEKILKKLLKNVFKFEINIKSKNNVNIEEITNKLNNELHISHLQYLEINSESIDGELNIGRNIEDDISKYPNHQNEEISLNDNQYIIEYIKQQDIAIYLQANQYNDMKIKYINPIISLIISCDNNLNLPTINEDVEEISANVTFEICDTKLKYQEILDKLKEKFGNKLKSMSILLKQTSQYFLPYYLPLDFSNELRNIYEQIDKIEEKFQPPTHKVTSKETNYFQHISIFLEVILVLILIIIVLQNKWKILIIVYLKTLIYNKKIK